MAELNVQRKRNSTWWIWLLLALIAIALAIYFWQRNDDADGRSAVLTDTVTNYDTNNTVTNLDTDTITNRNTDTVASRGPDTATANLSSQTWADIDFNSPKASYDEITDTNIDVRGNDLYAIYSLGENILFDANGSTIKKDGENKLRQIASSLNKRYRDSNIRIYGHTDSTGDAAANKQLAEQRARAVKTWLVKNAGVSEGNVSLHPLGEDRPLASNATEQGRQQNRSVEIVARQK
jgi:outer membrane protein OmpA-like peptidoglycan-associated protein